MRKVNAGAVAFSSVASLVEGSYVFIKVCRAAPKWHLKAVGADKRYLWQALRPSSSRACVACTQSVHPICLLYGRKLSPRSGKLLFCFFNMCRRGVLGPTEASRILSAYTICVW